MCHVTLVLGMAGAVGSQMTIDVESRGSPLVIHLLEDLRKTVYQLRGKIDIIESRQSRCHSYNTGESHI